MLAERLTPRQREVLALIATGRCYWSRWTSDPIPVLASRDTGRAIHATTVRSLRARDLIAAPDPDGFYNQRRVELTAAGRRAHAEEQHRG